jgi:hypothetical protein
VVVPALVNSGRVPIVSSRHDDVEGEAPFRIEALVDALEVQKAAPDEAGTCQQAERDGDLSDDDCGADALMRAVAGSGARGYPRPR